jgi:hypothetical protein
MHYRLIAVYEVRGIVRPKDGDEQVLVDYPSIGARAVIYPDMDAHLFEHDRALVIGNTMLDTLFGKANEGSFEEKVARALTDLRDRRRDEAKERLFVLYEAEGEIGPFNLRVQKELPEFIIAFEGAPKDAIRATHRPQINGLLASIAIGSEHVRGVKKIRDDIIFVNDSGKPVYTYDMKMSGRMSVSTSMEDAMLDFARDNAKVFAKHQDLASPGRLLIKSLDVENDELLSFLSAWSGLEIFINGSFRAYESSFFEKLRGGEKPIAPSKLVESMREVMKKKYGLLDKFALVSFELAGDSAEADIDEFQQIKKTRDSLIHGRDVPFDTLPTTGVRGLLRKYLKLHTERLRTNKGQ